MEVRLSRSGEVDLDLKAPPSKSVTHRALVCAALAGGRSTLVHPLAATDTLVTARALATLGVPVQTGEDAWVVDGCEGKFPAGDRVTIDCRNSGTSLRFLASLALLSPHPVVLTGDARMRERPIGPLADALEVLGGRVRFCGEPGVPPLEISGRLCGGRVVVDANQSSQFISSLLLAAPMADAPVEILLRGDPASRSYIDLSLDLIAAFGVRHLERDGYRRFLVHPDQYLPRRFTIEGDWSSALYFFAIAAVSGGRARVRNLSPTSAQGDRTVLSILEEMGCRVSLTQDGAVLARDGPLRGVVADMREVPDAVQTIAAVAAFAATPTTISGIAHLRYKESDRIAAVERMLGSVGVKTVEGKDSLTIIPGPMHGGVIDPLADHRTAMAGGVLGLGAGEVTITGAECVNKSFPGFWETLSGAELWNGLC
ncbi:MAG: 3-phosphoshikimate 1-carboxyvinyltransferase [Methanomicrobiaceae archaeon]|nr:3-phosphoshikimate 1-carboxyvinyltransferase [Methanomicrobiaceae archaeon]